MRFLRKQPPQARRRATASPSSLRDIVRTRLADEVGRIEKQAPFVVALAYPSPYAAGMSSLGYQRVYRAIMESPGLSCERAFLDDAAEGDILAQSRPLTYESRRPFEAFPVVAFSVAYEIEIGGLLRMIEAAGLSPLREERAPTAPLVVAGGPLTFSNPLPLAPFVDAMIVGEAEVLVIEVLRVVEASSSKTAALEALARIPHVFVPSHHGSVLPSVAKAPDEEIPAWAPIRTPHAVLADMFLVETERGCSRACTYCVMRRSTNGGMRLAPAEKILSLVPDDARRVGLVGAAVSDHPRIVDIVRTLADAGREVGLSSLRPDRLTDDLVGALRLAGARTLTTAMDGPSERLRDALERRARPKHLARAAELARKHGMDRLKLYLMVGLPGETDADIDECARFTTELSRVVPVSLGIAPFCAKRNTPLDGQPFAGIDVVEHRIELLRSGLRGRADVRATSARWAWAEYVLAQGDACTGLAVLDAVRSGGRFAAYRRAFERLAETRSAPPRRLQIAAV